MLNILTYQTINGNLWLENDLFTQQQYTTLQNLPHIDHNQRHHPLNIIID